MFLPSGTMCNVSDPHALPPRRRDDRAESRTSLTRRGARTPPSPACRCCPSRPAPFRRRRRGAAIRGAPLRPAAAPPGGRADRQHGRRRRLAARTRRGRAVAREQGWRTHMDGARLLNAVVAAGIPPAEIVAGFDTVWLDFTKGLGRRSAPCCPAARVHRPGLALEAAARRLHAAGRHLRRRLPLRPRPPRGPARRGPRQRAGPRARPPPIPGVVVEDRTPTSSSSTSRHRRQRRQAAGAAADAGDDGRAGSAAASRLHHLDVSAPIIEESVGASARPRA